MHRRRDVADIPLSRLFHPEGGLFWHPNLEKNSWGPTTPRVRGGGEPLHPIL